MACDNGACSLASSTTRDAFTPEKRGRWGFFFLGFVHVIGRSHVRKDTGGTADDVGEKERFNMKTTTEQLFVTMMDSTTWLLIWLLIVYIWTAHSFVSG